MKKTELSSDINLQVFMCSCVLLTSGSNTSSAMYGSSANYKTLQWHLSTDTSSYIFIFGQIHQKEMEIIMIRFCMKG